MIVNIINIAYLLMLIALTIKNILVLRIVLISAQAIFIIYAILFQNNVLLFWNSIFIIINIIWVIILILQQRPVKIPADIQDIYQKKFHDMSKREFIFLWQIGKFNTVADEPIIKQNIKNKELLLILQGTAIVVCNNKEIARLGRGDFIAEMSFMTGEPTSADVVALKQVTYIYWARENVANLEQLNHKLWLKINNILSKDLVGKMKKTNLKLKT